MRIQHHLAHGATVAALLGAAVLATPRAALGQDAAPRGSWQNFAGCWRPLLPTGMNVARWTVEPRSNAPILCIVPAADAEAAELVSVVGDSVAGRDTVVVGAAPRARQHEDCAGTRTAAWSADGARVYLHARYECTGGIEQSSSGLLALTTGQDLLDIQQAKQGQAKAVRVSRYARVQVPAALPRASADALAGVDSFQGLAREWAAAPLTVDAVADAARALGPEVVEALLIEHGDHYVIDAKRLVALADAGVPGRVTDVLVALAYPARFSIASAGGPDRNARPLTLADSIRLGAIDRVPRILLDPMMYNPLYGYSSLYGTRLYDYRYGYRYGDYGAGYRGGYGYYQPPIVVVRTNPPREHGRVVNGQGYTRDGSGDTGRSAEPRSGSSGSSGSSSSGSSSSSSSSGSSSSGGTRTAKPRP